MYTDYTFEACFWFISENGRKVYVEGETAFIVRAQSFCRITFFLQTILFGILNLDTPKSIALKIVHYILT